MEVEPKAQRVHPGIRAAAALDVRPGTHGDTFIQYPVPDDVPACILNLIDTMDKSSLCI